MNDKQKFLYSLVQRFPGFVTDEDVNAADVVEFLAEHLDAAKTDDNVELDFVRSCARDVVAVRKVGNTDYGFVQVMNMGSFPMLCEKYPGFRLLAAKAWDEVTGDNQTDAVVDGWET